MWSHPLLPIFFLYSYRYISFIQVFIPVLYLYRLCQVDYHYITWFPELLFAYIIQGLYYVTLPRPLTSHTCLVFILNYKQIPASWSLTCLSYLSAVQTPCNLIFNIGLVPPHTSLSFPITEFINVCVTRPRRVLFITLNQVSAPVGWGLHHGVVGGGEVGAAEAKGRWVTEGR